MEPEDSRSIQVEVHVSDLPKRSEYGGGTGIVGVVLDDIIVERQRQREMYPHALSRSPTEHLAILVGEVGEVGDEVLKMTVFDQENHDKYWQEMVQVAAVAIQALESMFFRKKAHEERMERRHGSGES